VAVPRQKAGKKSRVEEWRRGHAGEMGGPLNTSEKGAYKWGEKKKKHVKAEQGRQIVMEKKKNKDGGISICHPDNRRGGKSGRGGRKSGELSGSTPTSEWTLLRGEI